MTRRNEGRQNVTKLHFPSRFVCGSRHKIRWSWYAALCRTAQAPSAFAGRTAGTGSSSCIVDFEVEGSTHGDGFRHSILSGHAGSSRSGAPFRADRYSGGLVRSMSSNRARNPLAPNGTPTFGEGPTGEGRRHSDERAKPAAPFSLTGKRTTYILCGRCSHRPRICADPFARWVPSKRPHPAAAAVFAGVVRRFVEDAGVKAALRWALPCGPTTPGGPRSCQHEDEF